MDAWGRRGGMGWGVWGWRACVVLCCGSGGGMEAGCWARDYHGVVDGSIGMAVVGGAVG